MPEIDARIIAGERHMEAIAPLVRDAPRIARDPNATDDERARAWAWALIEEVCDSAPRGIVELSKACRRFMTTTNPAPTGT